jgi:DNA gyrase subunit B
MTHEKKNEEQNNEPIRALDPIDHIRLRPGMYFAGIDTRALNNLVDGLLEYVMHQVRQHTCSSLTVSILGPQTLQIRDNGEGVSPHKYNPTDKRDLASVMQRVGATHFVIDRARWSGGYGVMGIAQANAVSQHMHVEVRCDGALWEQRYSQGRKLSEIVRVRDLAEDEESGTSLTFTIDNEIFPDAVFDGQWLQGRLSDMAYLLPGFTVKFEDQVRGDRNAFYSRRGLSAYIEHENHYKRVLCAAMEVHMVVQRETVIPPFELDAALQFLRTPTPYTRSFVNTFETVQHGTHVDGCFDALRDSLLGHSDIIERHDMPYIFRHVTLVVNLWHPSPGFSFSGNGVRAITNRDIYQPIYEELSLALLFYFKEHPDCIPQLEALVLENRKQRHARRRSMRLI